MQVLVTRRDLENVRDEGSVFVFTGTDSETGDKLSFGVDHRPAQGLSDAVYQDEEVVAEVESWQVLSRVPLRKARIRRSPIGGPTRETAANYLPANYQVTEVTPEWVYFQGYDDHGWTLEDYVIPRLASGLIWAEEIVNDLGGQDSAPRLGADENDLDEEV